MCIFVKCREVSFERLGKIHNISTFDSKTINNKFLSLKVRNVHFVQHNNNVTVLYINTFVCGELNLPIEDWASIFTCPQKLTENKQIRDFQHKLLHYIILVISYQVNAN